MKIFVTQTVSTYLAQLVAHFGIAFLTGDIVWAVWHCTLDGWMDNFYLNLNRKYEFKHWYDKCLL